ncbi:MAG TPA: RlmE family RNA methyltransferase [Spirochaetia bacterium]|nr:RlmE family RNA methyltransferase [Spirochaetia bacterium]
MKGDYDGGPDFYATRARKEGYPARSVYKLEEIQNKLHILHQGDRVLDIGAAPGSWTLYAAKKVSPGGSVIAVDLSPLSLTNLPKNCEFLQGDAFGGVIHERILPRAPFDVVVSDAAPATTGNRTVDTGRSYQIAESVLDLSAELLRVGGNLVVKLFQGGDEREILERLRSEYSTARALKPKASRTASFETYCIGLGKLPPDVEK